MKNLIIVSVLFFLCIKLSAQNTVQTDDVAILKKQVSTLNQNSYRHEKQLKLHIKASQPFQDSINKQFNEYNSKLATVLDTLIVRESQIKVLQADLSKAQSDQKKSSIINYILLIILLIIIAGIYFQLHNLLKKEKLNNENRLMNAKEGIEAELNKVKKELEIIQRKIDEMKG